MATTAEYKLGEFDYPRGWFMLGDAEQISDGPTILHFFGRDLLFYRDKNQTLHLIEAQCSHMVQSNEIPTASVLETCEFSGLQNKSLPPKFGLGFNPEASCLTKYPVVERAGIIWMWHDPEGCEPDLELPKFSAWNQESDGWVKWVIDDYGTLPLHPIEIVDNMADFGHMGPIHGSLNSQYFDNIFDGHTLLQRFDAGHRTLTDANNATLSLDTWYEGPSILQVDMHGAFPSHMLIAHTPVDNGTVRVWHGLMVKMPDADAAKNSLEIARNYQRTSRDALAQDVEIWANKAPCFNPMQIPADGPYGKVRLWYSQFYNPREKAPQIHNRVNGQVVTFGEQRVVERAL